MIIEFNPPPRKILMIKAHSVGIGDVLRSSAAWRALKNKWPGVELHLLFLTKHQGYPSESFIRDHHLLSSSTFLPIRHGTPHDHEIRKISNFSILKRVWKLSKQINPDLVIDFEWTGTRTSVVSWIATIAAGAKSLGIAEFPLRSFFYTHSTESKRLFVLNNELSEPFDYTLRDFIVLRGIGIERNGLPIELLPSPDSVDQISKLLPVRSARLRVGINIGCATEGASHKRMDLNKLAECIKAWQAIKEIELYLTGAVNERSINQEFLEILKNMRSCPPEAHDFAGRTDGKSLTALISQMDLFVSTDSGPYHMAVGLKIPTLCWFTSYGPGSLHRDDWVCSLVQPSVEEFLTAVKKLSTLAVR